MKPSDVDVDITGHVPQAEPPKRWQAQFPYHQDGDALVARRDLLHLCVYTSGALCAGTAALAVLGQALPPGTREERPLLRVSELPEGQAHYFNYPGEDDQAMLLHLPGGGFVAFSQKCTHLSCAVSYQPARERLYCPCHEGVFDPQTGVPVAGPPRRRLPRVLLEQREDMLYAVGLVP